jgi:acetoacetyl-[acyl-carrier protein] synthase
VHAHGSSTPQNRVTESHIINETAKAFGIEHWPVAAIKAYLGHTIGSAAGDQVNSTLGIWQYGFIPGIKTIDKIADDVYSSHLNISRQDINVGVEGIDVAFINTKGFGGNNATASILAPHIVASMLKKKHGKKAMVEHAMRNKAVAAQAAENDVAITQGRLNPVYLFDHNVVNPYAINVQAHALTIPGYAQQIDLNIDNPYEDMC